MIRFAILTLAILTAPAIAQDPRPADGCGTEVVRKLVGAPTPERTAIVELIAPETAAWAETKRLIKTALK